jgi:hypothetical protein
VRAPGGVALHDAPEPRARAASAPEPPSSGPLALAGAPAPQRTPPASSGAQAPRASSSLGRALERPREPGAARGALPAPPLAPAATVHEPERPRAPSAPESSPYALRTGPRRLEALERHGGDQRTESAVERGLLYLARVQVPLGDAGGLWGELEVVDEKYGHVAIGKSALCLLAFLGAGHTHREGAHSEVVRRGLAFLLAVQDEESGHFGPTSAYSHGLATLALAECRSLTQDPALDEPLRRAVRHMLEQQTRSRDPALDGGWGYYGPEGRQHDRWPRVSVTAWQVLALVSARASGIAVPDEALERARAFLVTARDPREGWLRYSQDPDRLRSEWPTLPASTPAGLFALSLLGEDVAASRHARAVAFTLERAPSAWRRASDDDFVRRARGNPYFWYQGTLLAFRLGGGAWSGWNEALKASLLPAQAEDGSWPPIDVYAREYARDREGDASYSTALAVLSLEVYYRYHLPLLRALPEPEGGRPPGALGAAAPGPR